jgi:mannose-6-phosphate isomerase-like protein (cupin superfamily)
VIQEGSSAALHPGDVVVIPAGTPHQMRLAAGERITYLAFKVPTTSPAPPAPRRP